MLMTGESVLWPIGHKLSPGTSISLLVVAVLLMWAGSKCVQKIPSLPAASISERKMLNEWKCRRSTASQKICRLQFQQPLGTAVSKRAQTSPLIELFLGFIFICDIFLGKTETKTKPGKNPQQQEISGFQRNLLCSVIREFLRTCMMMQEKQ